MRTARGQEEYDSNTKGIGICGTGSVFPGAGTRYIGAEGLVPGTKWFEPPRAGQQQNALARRHLYQPLGLQRALYFGDFRK